MEISITHLFQTKHISTISNAKKFTMPPLKESSYTTNLENEFRQHRTQATYCADWTSTNYDFNNQRQLTVFYLFRFQFHFSFHLTYDFIVYCLRFFPSLVSDLHYKIYAENNIMSWLYVLALINVLTADANEPLVNHKRLKSVCKQCQVCFVSIFYTVSD